ncbi:heme-binding domain-containing protein [Flavobacteriaceae bacterium AH-315-B10]|nr:heme-binding domain-containing protein [Flavobacteriaceae bacterium AH-315-B10]
MKKYIKKIGIALLVVFIGIQFIPKTYNQSDTALASDFMTIFDVPEGIETQLKTSCYDCHSNNTYYPWYNKLQPVAWFLEDHITEAKGELNFNEFGEYSKRRQKSKLKSIISQIRDDEMPLTSYTLMHWDAKLSDKEKEVLMDWVDNLRDSL